MKTFLLRNPKRILAIAGLASICGLFGTASAQTHPERVYANSEGWTKSGVNIEIPLVAPAVQPYVDLPDNPITISLKDSSILSTGSGGLASIIPSLTQYLKFPTSVPANTPIHLKVSLPVGLLNAAGLLGNVEVGTFTGLTNGGTGGGASVSNHDAIYTSDNGLLNLLNGKGTNEIIITPSVACDGVYINLSAILSASTVVETTVNVFHAYYINENVSGDAGCPTPVDVLSGVAASTGIGNIANAIGSVDGVWNAIDDDPTYTTYATMNVGAGVLSRTYLDAIYTIPAKAHDSAAIVLQDPGNGLLSLVSLGVLSSLSIQPFMDNTPVGSEIPINSNLLRLKLLPTTQNIYEITVPVDAGDFNKIEVRFNGIADVARGLRVYNIGVKVPAPTITEGTLDKYAYEGNSVDLNSFVTPSGTDGIIWYDAAEGGNVVNSPLTMGTTGKTLYAASLRDGCSDLSGRTQLNLHIATIASDPLPEGKVGDPYSQVVTADVVTNPGLSQTPVYSFTLVNDPLLTYFTPANSTGSINTSPEFNTYSNIAMAQIPSIYPFGPMSVINSQAFATTDLTNGLSFDDATGTVSGKPETEGTYHLTLKVHDDANGLDAGTTTQDITISPSALPVTLTNFDVNLDANKNAVVTWTTESEQGSIRFDVLRSNDGTNFSTIGSVDAAGISTKAIDYSFTDHNPGAKSYYKLNVVKNDGIKTSNIVSITGGRVAGFSINPNPASNDITITGLSDIKTVSIYDASGRLVQTATNSHISVRNLSQGIYFVTVVTKDGNKVNSKFIKK